MESLHTANLKELTLKCPICYELYSNSHKPFIMPCGHTVCSECFQRIKKQSEEDVEEDYHSNEDEDDVSLESEEEDDEEEENNEDEDDDEGLSGSDSDNSSENENEEEEKDDEEENQIVMEEIPENENLLPIQDTQNKFIGKIDENEDIAGKTQKKIKIKCSICRKKMKIFEDEVVLNKNVIAVINSLEQKPAVQTKKIETVFCKVCRLIDTETNHLSKTRTENHKNFLIELSPETYKSMQQRYTIGYSNIMSKNSELISFLRTFILTLFKREDVHSNTLTSLRDYFLSNAKATYMKIKSMRKLTKLYSKFNEHVSEFQKVSNSQSREASLKCRELMRNAEQCLQSAEILCEKYFIIIDPYIRNYTNIFQSAQGEFFNNLAIKLYKEEVFKILRRGFFETYLTGIFPSERRFVATTTDTPANTILIYDFRLHDELLVSYSRIYYHLTEGKRNVPSHVEKYFTNNIEIDEEGNMLYLIGKKDMESKIFHTYDLRTRELLRRKNIPCKFYSTDAKFYNGKLFIFGGSNKNDDPVKECYLYDKESDWWEEMPTLTNGKINKAVAICNNKFYVFGGAVTGEDEDRKDNLSYVFEVLDYSRICYDDFKWNTFTVKNYNETLQSFGYGFLSRDLLVIIGGEDLDHYDEKTRGYLIDIQKQELIEEFSIQNSFIVSFNVCGCFMGEIAGSRQADDSFDKLDLRRNFHKIKATLY